MNAWKEFKLTPTGATYPLTDCLDNLQNLEANCYFLFENVMQHLEPLYNPKNTSGGTPAIVSFCCKVQGKLYLYSGI